MPLCKKAYFIWCRIFRDYIWLERNDHQLAILTWICSAFGRSFGSSTWKRTWRSCSRTCVERWRLLTLCAESFRNSNIAFPKFFLTSKYFSEWSNDIPLIKWHVFAMTLNKLWLCTSIFVNKNEYLYLYYVLKCKVFLNQYNNVHIN